MSRPGRTFRILVINDTSDDYHAVWTVELEEADAIRLMRAIID